MVLLFSIQNKILMSEVPMGTVQVAMVDWVLKIVNSNHAPVAFFPSTKLSSSQK